MANISIKKTDPNTIVTPKTGFVKLFFDSVAKKFSYIDDDGSYKQIGSQASSGGTTWTSGNSIPSDSSGANGDFFFKKDDARLYKKVGGTWVLDYDYALEIGGGGTPAGNDLEVQFNDNGSFGSNPYILIDDSGGITRFKVVGGMGQVISNRFVLDDNNSNTVSITKNSATGTYSIELPDDNGSSGQYLITNGSGKWTWGDIIAAGDEGGIQYNKLGALTASANFFYDEGTSTFIVCDIDGNPIFAVADFTSERVWSMGDLLNLNKKQKITVSDANEEISIHTDFVYKITNSDSNRFQEMNSVDGIFKFGDIDAHFSGDVFSIDETANRIKFKGDSAFVIDNLADEHILFIDPFDKRVDLGDYFESSNKTRGFVDDLNKQITFQTDNEFFVSNSSAVNYLHIDTDNDLVILGDSSGSTGDRSYIRSQSGIMLARNSHMFQLQDHNGQAKLYADFDNDVYGFGDTDGNSNGLYIWMESSKLTVKQNGITLYNLPDVDGDENQVVTTDGLGNWGYSNVVATKKVTLSQAQLLLVNTNLVQAISAVGVDKLIRVLDVYSVYSHNTTTYTTAGALKLVYDGDITAMVSENNTAIVSGAEVTPNQTWTPLQTNITSPPTNKGIQVWMDGPNPTGGDGTLDIYITYQVISVN